MATVPELRVSDCEPAVVSSIVPPNEIAPGSVLVLMTEEPVNIVGTAFVIVKELAVILLPIFT